MSSPECVDMNSGGEEVETKPIEDAKVSSESTVDEKPRSPESVDMNSGGEEVETNPESDDTKAATKSKTELKRKIVGKSNLEEDSGKKYKTEIDETVPEQISGCASETFPVEQENAEVAEQEHASCAQPEEAPKEPKKASPDSTAEAPRSRKPLQVEEIKIEKVQEMKESIKDSNETQSEVKTDKISQEAELVHTGPIEAKPLSVSEKLSCSDKDLLEDNIFGSIPPHPPSPKNLEIVVSIRDDMEQSKHESETSDDFGFESERTQPARRTTPTAAMMRRELLSQFRTDSSDSDSIVTGLFPRTQLSPRNPKKVADLASKTSKTVSKTETYKESSEETITDASSVQQPEIDDSIGYSADMEESWNTSTTKSDTGELSLSEDSAGETLLATATPKLPHTSTIDKSADLEEHAKLTQSDIKREGQEKSEAQVENHGHSYPDLTQLSLHKSKSTDDHEHMKSEENPSSTADEPSSNSEVISEKEIAEASPVLEEMTKSGIESEKISTDERKITDSPNIFDPEYIKFMERCKTTPAKETAGIPHSCPRQENVDISEEIKGDESEASGKDYDSESTEVTSLTSDLLAVSGYSSETRTGTSTSSEPLAGPSRSTSSSMIRNMSEFIPDFNEDSSQMAEDASFPCISDDTLSSSKECLEPPTDSRLIELYVRIAEARSQCSRKSCEFPRQKLISEFMSILSSEKTVPFQSSDVHKISVMIGPAVTEFDVKLDTAQQHTQTDEVFGAAKDFESSERTG